MVLLLLLTSVAGASPYALTKDVYWIDEPVVVESGPSTWRLSAGYLFPIADEVGPAGVVFVGSGVWEVSFPDSGERRRTADQLVMFGGQQADDLRSVAAGDAPLSLPVDIGVWISADPSDLLDQAVPVRWSRRLLITVNEDGEEVVIAADHMGQGAARAKAARQLQVRAEWMRRHWRDPGVLLTLDRRFDHEVASVIADLRTDIRWDRTMGMGGATANRAPQVWLAAVHDPRGLLDASRSHQVVARTTGEARRAEELLISGEHFPEHSGVARPPDRAVLERMEVRADLDLALGESIVRTRFEARLALRASDHPVDHLVLSLPHTLRDRWYSDPPLADSWTLGSVTDEQGRTLEVLPLAITGDETEGYGDHRTFAIALAEPLVGAHRQVITLKWSENVRFRHQLITECCGYNLGATTGPLRVAPILHPLPALPVPLQITAVTTAPKRHRMVSSGTLTAAHSEGGHRWRQTRTSAAEAVVALGRWREFTEPGEDGLPTVRLVTRSLDKRGASRLASSLRQILSFYAPLLPDYPHGELAVMEEPATLERIETRGASGVVALTPLVNFTEGLDRTEAAIRIAMPHLEAVGLATALARQPFVHVHTTPGDTWIPEVLPSVYAMLLLEAAFGDEAAQLWLASHRKTARFDRAASVGRPSSPAGLSTRVLALHGLFRHQYGDRALLAAMDHLASGRETLTTDGFRRALERETGRPQQDFVDAWLVAGLAPELDLDWDWRDGVLAVEVRSDVPFGRYEVPVMVDGEEVWVSVIDGLGRAELPAVRPPERIEIHPSFPSKDAG